MPSMEIVNFPVDPTPEQEREIARLVRKHDGKRCVHQESPSETCGYCGSFIDWTKTLAHFCGEGLTDA